MDPYVTPAKARADSKLLAADFPEPDPPVDPDPLTDLLLAASGVVGALTGRALVSGADDAGEAVPAYLAPVAERAVIIKAEQLDTRSGGTATQRRKALRGSNLASISAGPWSESYFNPATLKQSQMIDLDPELNELLWALATEDRKDEWIAFWTGRFAPAAALQSFEYGARPGNYAPWSGLPLGDWLPYVSAP